MKSFTVCLIIFSFSTILAAQDTTKQLNFGIGLNYRIVGGHDIYMTSNPQLLFSYKNHTTKIGTLIVPTPDFYFINNGFPLLIYNASKKNMLGFQMAYKYYPIKNNKILNFFFDYNFALLKSNINYTKEHYNYALQKRESYNVDLKIFNCYHFIGYGFDINLSKQLYFTTNVGFGIGGYDYKSNPGFIDGMEMGTNKTKISPALLINVGAGYNFLKKRK